MRAVTLSRRRLDTEPLPLPGGQTFDPARARTVFDEWDLPDGFPFVVDDDGGLTGCRFLNQYLVEAYGQRAFDLQNMREHRIYPWPGCCASSRRTGPSGWRRRPGRRSRTGWPGTGSRRST